MQPVIAILQSNFSPIQSVPITTNAQRVPIPITRDVLSTTLCDKVCQWLDVFLRVFLLSNFSGDDKDKFER
jgi:hypothetical protein